MTHLKLHVLTVSIILSLTSSCDGGTEIFDTLTPRIAMDVCQPEGPCGVQMGEATTGAPKRQRVDITNEGEVPLTLLSVSLATTTDPSFLVESAPGVLEPGQTGAIEVVFSPTVEGAVRGTLIIRSDAANVVCDERTDCRQEADGNLYRDLRLDLEGTGRAGGLPELTIDKVACDFGAVGLGVSALCTISVGNEGDGDLLIDDVRLSENTIASGSAGDVFAFTAPVGQGVAPGTRVSLNITFYPDAMGTYASVMEIMTNDPVRPRLQIELTGHQIDVPTCNVRIAAVNNVPVTGVQEVEPLDDVTLSALTSTPGSEEVPLTSVTWTFIERPPGSTISFTGQGDMLTGLTFADGVQGIDLAGHYRIAAQVIDAQGTPSQNLCEVAFDAVPQENLLVQLGWESPTGDMDVHLIKMADVGFCSSFAGPQSLTQDCDTDQSVTDCHFANCTAGGLDWDNDGDGHSSGDPSLDIDDRCGFGPENISVPTPEPGEYLVAIHYWSAACGGSAEPVDNTIRIFANGVLVHEAYRSLTVHEWWEAAIIHWPQEGGQPCVEPLDQPGACN